MSKIADPGSSSPATRLLSFALASLAQLKSVLLARSGRGRERRMVLLESLELGNRRQLFLVACEDHRFLVGAGADRIGTVVAMPEVSSHDPSTRQSQATPVPSWPLRTGARRQGFAATEGFRGLQLVKLGTSAQHDADAGGSQWR